MRNPPQAKAVASGRCTFSWASSSGALKLRSTSVPLLLIPGTIVREGLQVIARDPQLNPSAVLEITSVRGRLAVARIVRGQPQPKDEVVLPDPELAEQALSLAP